MITEPTLPIERKGFDLILVPNYLHVVMLAEPGWVIPAGGMNAVTLRYQLATLEWETGITSTHFIAKLPVAAQKQ